MAEPKIRFKRDDESCYPEWKEVRLGDVASRVTRKNTNNETDRPLTIASIEGLVDQRTYFEKTVASKDISGYFLLKNGEYAYNKSYSVGYDYGSIKRLDKYDMGALSTLYICFALNDGENSDFFNCYFNGLSWYNQMAEICAEGARNHGLLNVSANDFFNIRLSVPSNPEEQQKIADFSSSVDEVIAASEAEVQNLETQKKAVMKKIFSQEVRFKKEDGTDFPKWSEALVEDIGTVVTGSTPPTKEEDNYGGKYLWASPADIVTNEYVTDTDRKLTEKGWKVARHLPAGSVLITCIASIGKNSILAIEGSCNQQINAIIPNEKMIAHFILEAINYKEHDLQLLGGNGGMKIVSKSLFEKFSLPYPCFEEQRLIADFLSNFDEAISTAKKELELWKELKKGLLQQMFV